MSRCIRIKTLLGKSKMSRMHKTYITGFINLRCLECIIIKTLHGKSMHANKKAVYIVNLDCMRIQ